MQYASSLVKHCYDGRQESRTMGKSEFEDKEIKLGCSFDYINLTHLIINNPSDDFTMISLKLNICGQEIFKVSFNLWENIDPNFLEKKDNINIYNLPWNNYLLKDIVMYPLNNKHKIPVSISIEYEGSCEKSLLYYEELLLGEIDRKNVFKVENNSNYFLQEYKYSISQASDFSFSGYCCGLYIIGCNMDYLTGFRFTLNRYIMIDYDKLEVNLFFKKINDNCFYIPLNCNKKSDEVTNDGFCFFNSFGNKIEFFGVDFVGSCYIFSKNKISYDKGHFNGVGYFLCE